MTYVDPYELSEKETKRLKAAIDTMSREEMCRLWRFAPSGDPYFVTGNGVAEYFRERFDKLGGFSPQISKAISTAAPEKEGENDPN